MCALDGTEPVHCAVALDMLEVSTHKVEGSADNLLGREGFTLGLSSLMFRLGNTW